MRYLTLILIFIFASCQQKSANFEMADEVVLAETPAAASAPPPPPVVDGSKSKNEKVPDVDKTTNLTNERKLMKEGDISFETNDCKAMRELINKSVTELQGYISDDKIHDFDTRKEFILTIRIPSDKFDLFLERLSNSAAKINKKNIRVLDVTEEYIDVEARIKTQKELENRYKELLKKANKVDEILSIESQIGDLRTDIESSEGRLRYLKDRINLSTLNVTFYEKSTTDFGFGGKIGEAFSRGWTNLLSFLISITSVWPFILGLITFIYLLRRNKWSFWKNYPSQK